MKVTIYYPLPGEYHTADSGSPLPVAAVADTVLHHQSLWEAIEELQREGYKNEQGKEILIGIGDLLEEVKTMREQLFALLNEHAALQRKRAGETADKAVEQQHYLPGRDGPPLSGKPMDGASFKALARLMSSKDRKSKLTPREALLLKNLAHKIEQLEKTLKRVYWGFDLESIDEGLLEEMLGEERLKNWHAIKNLSSQMVKEGYVQHGLSGLRLTSRGLQKIAWYILREIFKLRKSDPLSRRHQAPHSSEPPAAHETRAYRFGDPLHLDLSRSVLNAVKRAGIQLPVRISAEDFVIYDREPCSRSATVLLIDMSKSMRFENRYVSAKRVALALYELIRLRFPQDRIAVVSFSMQAKKIRTEEIPFLHWDEMNPYTNMEQALDVARKTLTLHRGYRRQIFLITDGEPTAHRERGNVFFQFPPHPHTLQRTLRAAQSLARQKIALSIFLLSQEKSPVRFVNEMAKKASARVFHISPHDLGQCVLMDYIDKKKKWI